ncbi:MAG: M1 family metallopeptidase, partial [Calditrichaeota bacterium]|nr:M1 family metallopeptidase [Calditrichota bacterium]
MESGSGLVSGFSESDYGHVSIHSMKISGSDYSDRMAFYQPDDNNLNDSTVVRVLLDNVVDPGDSLLIEMDFTSKLPKLVRRTGFIDNETTKQFYLVAQWFPKIGVLEAEGWNCHQFHANTEFFSDYGVYNVSMTVPRDFIVGASGLEVERNDQAETITYTYHAEDIHDFMWTAYPGFKVFNTQHKAVQIRMLYNEGQSQVDVDAQIQSLKYGLDYYQDRFGPYPYPNITFLNAPEGASAANGMEYPTIFTAGYLSFMPDGVLFKSEMVTIHEFGHQIFYGVIGSNEFQWSWMDEGFNQFGELGTEDFYYGGAVVLPDLKIKAADFNRFLYIMKPNNENILTYSFKQNANNYSINSYMRPAMLLKTMEQYLGEEKFYQGMRHYYQKWKFKHPRPDDF